MKFTKSMSVNDILDIPGMRNYISIIFPRMLLDCVNEENREYPISQIEMKVKMPWGGPFISDAFLSAAEKVLDMLEKDRYLFIPLWSREQDYIPQSNNDKESVFLMTIKGKKTEKRPAAVICAGGGYELLSYESEGLEMAERMNQLGYVPFVLNYRVKPNYYPAPQIDLALAIKHIRVNAEKYGIDSENILLMGSSAGGHLCASMIENVQEIENELLKELKYAEYDLKDKYRKASVIPAALCLNYSVISFRKYGHEESFLALANGEENLRDKLCVEKHVNTDFPKTFLWACEDDEMVSVNNTRMMDKALDEKGILHEVRIFPQGGHGCGTGEGTSAESWMDDMNTFMKNKAGF